MTDAHRLAVEAEAMAGDGRRDVQPAVRALLSRLAVGLRAEADAREEAERNSVAAEDQLCDAESALARLAAERDAAVTAAGQAKEALADFAEHGLRCDLNPTMNLRTAADCYDGYTRYLRRADEAVRERARIALAAIERNA